MNTLTATLRSGPPRACLVVAAILGVVTGVNWQAGVLAAALLLGLTAVLCLAAHPEIGLYAYIVAIPFQRTFDLPMIGPKFTLAEAVLILTLAFLVARALVAGGQPSLPRVPYCGPISNLLLAALISAAALRPDELVVTAYAVELSTLLSLAILYLVLVNHFRSQPHGVIKVLRMVVVGLLLSTAAGLVGAYDLLRGRGLVSPFVYAGARIVGTFRNPNALASFFLFALFVVAGLWLSTPVSARGARRLFATSFISGSLVLLASASRGGYAGFIAGGLCFLLLAGEFRRRAFVLLGSSLVVAISMAVVVLSRTAGSITYLTAALKAFLSLGSDPEFLGRLAIWREAWPIITTHPLVGAGLGSFQFEFARQLHSPAGAEAHSTALSIWAETGVLGLVGAIWIGGVVARDLWRAYVGTKGLQTRGVIIGLLAAGAALATNSFSQNIQRHRHLWVFLALVAVLTHYLPQPTSTRLDADGPPTTK